ncbi:CGNR zinc finger domain-containing protein [Saccharopolyspora rhizosphaerae]|uniref:CGNR zinc finger domain-containing protein n=1 Tax=Saccharopolyspora rhizosphaerae TaxID=2492662 RepID=A0A426JJ15_9PSEU|nr:CGNR zinc finger domain-containing protein [Saccharopolyspora rhizosphaerae]RRO13117.1 CGNR zinc finger domain-containing protein [Saccharopolyspora rhizosphaerae]
MFTVPLLDLSCLVEFVNEYADRPRAVADEQAAPYPDASELLAWPGGFPEHTLADLAGVANAIYGVFSSAGEGRALDELNVVLRSTGPTPVATESGLRWTVDRPEGVLPAALATCVLDWLLNHGQARIGTCGASHCVDVYADASPAGRRVFCSSTCLNRHKVAAHRRRRSRSREQPG